MSENEHMVNKGKGTQADVLKIMFIKTSIGHLLHLGRRVGKWFRKVKLQCCIFSGSQVGPGNAGMGGLPSSPRASGLQQGDRPWAGVGIRE